jgi:hypothetical protein
MKDKLKKYLFFAWVLLCTQLTYAQNFSIEFVHMVNKEALKLDTATYTNSLSQPFTITKFKYYIGNIILSNKKGKKYTSNNYFLINEADELSKKITLPTIPNDEYTNIEFIVGVDSIHNCSGVQTGSLDPMNAMFWTWNTGYIFMKLEGNSPTSTMPANLIEYHIGGYKEPNNSIRKISLPIHTLKENKLKIKVDVAAIFTGNTIVDFSKLPSVTDAKNATRIADNYVKMFSIINE